MIPAAHLHEERLPARAQCIPRRDDPRNLAQALGERPGRKRGNWRNRCLQRVDEYALSSGDAALLLSAPGVGNTGRVSIDVDLSTMPWLQFDWTGNGSYTDNPLQAFGIFGRYRGHDRIIYWSEQR